MAEVTLYEAVGGMPFFEALVGAFYDGVASDPELLAVYPTPEDLGPARRRLTLFLAQYWGGPTTYSDERGHPRLRLRHMPFAIGIKERDQWLACMDQAMGEVGVDPQLRERLRDSFFQTADWMRNTPH
jgi:hemoglobin